MWETDAAARHLREGGQKTINPALLIEAIEKQREIVRAAQAKTRKMHRKQQIAHRPATIGIDTLWEDPAPPAEGGIDWSKPAKPFDGEIW